MDNLGEICRICGGSCEEVFRSKVLHKYDVSYVRCSHCAFLQAEDPFWLDESYFNPINKEDTGYVSRNIRLARKTFLLVAGFFRKGVYFLDYASGYGMFVRLMRDMGLDFYWEDQYTKNIFAQGFEYNGQEVSAVTCFECFEHFPHPMEDVEKILLISRNIFFSTLLYDANNAGNIPDASWPYYGFSHGQHISFYSLKTLQYIADKYKLYFYSNGRDLHMFSDRKISTLRFKIILILGGAPWDILSRFIRKSKTSEDSLSVSGNKD
jgi:hypothetical protein